MNLRQTAIELLSTGGFLIGDTTLVEFLRNQMAIRQQPKKRSGFDWSPETKALAEQADRHWNMTRAIADAKRRGPGLPGLRKALRERGRDLS